MGGRRRVSKRSKAVKKLLWWLNGASSAENMTQDTWEQPRTKGKRMVTCGSHPLTHIIFFPVLLFAFE